MKQATRALGAAFFALLAGCSQLSFLQPTDGLRFELSGRIAVRYGDESSSGNVAWRHRSNGDEMLISSPLGQGIARIVRRGDEVTLTTSEPRDYHAANAELLTEEVLGFRLPLTGLSDWVRGRPAPGPSRERRDGRGRLAELEQSGWRIEYLAYGEDGALPARMRLLYPGLELRLAISAWR